MFRFRGQQGDEGQMQGRFDKFDEQARKVLTLAQEEALRLNHHYIGTEHLLLGLADLDDSTAVRILKSLDVKPQKVRIQVEMIIGHKDHPVEGAVGLTPRAKKVMELAVDEARRLNHHSIGTEHLLLGLIREGEGIAAGVLTSMGVNLERVRNTITQVTYVRRTDASGEPGSTKNNVVTCRIGDRDLDAIDALIEAGIRTTRSDAAAWLIHAGIEAHRDLLDRVYATVAEIRRLRAEAQALALGNGDGNGQEETPAAESAEPPRNDAEPPEAPGEEAQP